LAPLSSLRMNLFWNLSFLSLLNYAILGVLVSTGVCMHFSRRLCFTTLKQIIVCSFSEKEVIVLVRMTTESDSHKELLRLKFRLAGRKWVGRRLSGCGWKKRYLWSLVAAEQLQQQRFLLSLWSRTIKIEEGIGDIWAET
jgi:hypothetical protein